MQSTNRQDYPAVELYCLYKKKTIGLMNTQSIRTRTNRAESIRTHQINQNKLNYMSN